MSATTKIAVGVASGYLLGRTKKLRFAITVGSMLAGQRVATNPAALLKQASQLIEKNPELAKLQDRITGELFDAARNAALAQASSRIDSANRALTAGRGEQDEDEQDEDEDEYDEPAEDEPDEDQQDEDEYD